MTQLSLYLLSLLELIGNWIYFSNFKVGSKGHNQPLFVKGLWSSLCSSGGSKEMRAELSYILAEFFNMCLKESCFSNCWKVSSMIPPFENVRERSAAKNYHPVSLSGASKVFEKLVNNRLN